MSGMYSEVGGMFSATSNMKTEKASRTVSPRVTFSPDSGGSRKPVSDRLDRSMHGMITLRK